jgi:hypothetical protein
MTLGRRFRRRRDGRYQIKLGAAEQELLRELPRQAVGLLETDDPSTLRLHPTAYPNDEVASADYRSLTSGELSRQHQVALDTMSATASATVIDEEQLHRWLRAIEVLRLVLGTQLDVSEGPEDFDPSDPRAPAIAVYHYLSGLQDDVVDALTAALPAATDDGDNG